MELIERDMKVFREIEKWRVCLRIYTVQGGCPIHYYYSGPATSSVAV